METIEGGDFLEDDRYIKVIVEGLNQLGVKWENPKVDELTYELYLEKENTKKWRKIAEDMLQELEKAADWYGEGPFPTDPEYYNNQINQLTKC